MKRCLCLLLALLLVLTSCSELREDEIIEYDDTLLMQEIDLSPSIVINPLLYFLNESATRLTPETREIFIPQNHRKENYIVQALINGPRSDALVPVAEGFVLEYTEVMTDVTNVYLLQEESKTPEEIFNIKMAIAATLSDFTGNRFVNVFIDGVQTAYFGGVPTGALQKLSSDLFEERMTLQNKSEMANPDMQAVLYYLDASEQYLLPEVGNLVFKDQDYVTTLVEQLIKGPDDPYNHRPVLDSSLKLLGQEPFRNEDGETIIRLHFNKEPVAFTERFVDGKKIALAALTYTITSFVPDAKGIEIVVGTMQAGEGVYKAEMYQDLIGSEITVYLPGSDTSSMLVGIPRVISQEIAHYPSAVLRQLMKGPTEIETGVYPAMPEGITMDVVKDVYVAGDMVVIDMDASVNQVMEQVSDDHAYLMIYSIVNTLTSMEDVRRVQFLLDGERVEYFGEGRINLIDPLVRNPGIIRST